VVKASQVGGSVYAILRALHACLSGLNTMDFFSTRTDVLDFSKSRVAPLIEANRFLAEAVRDNDWSSQDLVGSS